MAITIIHNNIVHSSDSGLVSALVLLDFGSAFDAVDHSILLDILSERFGVEKLELDWFRSYHTGYKQTFKTPVDSSDPVSLICSNR